MISAIVVSHQARAHLDHCLRALAGEQLVSEVLVVDNASSDGSQQLVRREHPRVRLLELEQNLGFGAANNRAVGEARGDLLLLINSDAWLLGDALEQLQHRLQSDPELGLVAPQLVYPEGGPQMTWAPDTSVLGETVQKLRQPWERHWWCHRQLAGLLRLCTGPGWLSAACVLLRREAFASVDGFDEAFFLYFEDVDLCLRLRRRGWRIEQVFGAQAAHVKGASSRNGGSELAYRRSQLAFYRKHRPRWEKRLIEARLRRHIRRCQDPTLARGLESLLRSP